MVKTIIRSLQSFQNDSVFISLFIFFTLHNFFIHNANLISYGIWKIEATYADTFKTTATAEFVVKEYGKTNISGAM